MPTTIPFKITICGIDELPGHSAVGVTHVLSILDPEYPVPEVFGEYGEHERLELRFHDIIDPDVPGLIPPNEEHVSQLLEFGRDVVEEADASLLVHCHAGVSRSTASMILIVAQARPQASALEIAMEILRIRSKAWPNLRMIEIGDRMLERDRTLVAAVQHIYREQLQRRPDLARLMTDGGRAREVAAGRALA